MNTKDAYNLFNMMQYNFDYTSCTIVFREDAKHYWDKWIASNFNIINFINRLDDSNKKLLFQWGEKYFNN